MHTPSLTFLANMRVLPMMLCVFLLAAGCEKAPPPPLPTNQTPTTAPETPMAASPGETPLAQPAPAAPLPAPPPSPAPASPPPVVVPAGTRIAIRLDSALGSNTSVVGERFTAVVARPVHVKGVEVISAQSAVVGKIMEAKAAGKFAGASSLVLRLQSVADQPVVTTAYSQHVQGKGQRSAVVIGGTALAGALLGGLAGHGRGALIGAAAGGGVGTLGAAETGNNRDITLPAGAVVTFQLTKALTIGSNATP